jgi:hypothetical protein
MVSHPQQLYPLIKLCHFNRLNLHVSTFWLRLAQFFALLSQITPLRDSRQVYSQAGSLSNPVSQAFLQCEFFRLLPQDTFFKGTPLSKSVSLLERASELFREAYHAQKIPRNLTSNCV